MSYCSHLQELVLNHSTGMCIILRWVHEVGSTSSKYGASNLPSQVYYCNFLFFDSTQGHPWIALHWKGYVWSPMQSAAFWGFVWSKNKDWWGGYHTVSQNSSPYFPLHLLHTSTSTQFSKWQCSLATYKPCYLFSFS